MHAALRALQRENGRGSAVRRYTTAATPGAARTFASSAVSATSAPCSAQTSANSASELARMPCLTCASRSTTSWRSASSSVGNDSATEATSPLASALSTAASKYARSAAKRPLVVVAAMAHAPRETRTRDRTERESGRSGHERTPPLPRACCNTERERAYWRGGLTRTVSGASRCTRRRGRVPILLSCALVRQSLWPATPGNTHPPPAPKARHSPSSAPNLAYLSTKRGREARGYACGQARARAQRFLSAWAGPGVPGGARYCRAPLLGAAGGTLGVQRGDARNIAGCRPRGRAGGRRKL